jgi:hypothetical protein
MRIKAKYVLDPIEAGASRLRRKFAWLPIRISDDYVWLEFYEILQAYLVTPVVLPIKGKPTTFTLGKWTDISTRLIP